MTFEDWWQQHNYSEEIKETYREAYNAGEENNFLYANRELKEKDITELSEEIFIRRYPEYVMNGEPLSPYYDLFASGYEIANIEKHNKIVELQNRNDKLAGQKASLERWLGKAKEIIRDLLDNTDEYARQRAEDFLKEDK